VSARTDEHGAALDVLRTLVAMIDEDRILVRPNDAASTRAAVAQRTRSATSQHPTEDEEQAMNGIEAGGCWVFRDMIVPEHMREGITQWIENGIPPGDFLCAILRNDLKDAVGRADDTNLRNIPAFVSFFYNCAPAQCWGSIEQFEAWRTMHQRIREANAEERARRSADTRQGVEPSP
jgi:hypothetical protein